MYYFVNECTTSLRRLPYAIADIETITRGLADVGEARSRREAKVGSFKEFWQTASNALSDWPKTTRMCALITAVSLNWALAQWLLWH